MFAPLVLQCTFMFVPSTFLLLVSLSVLLRPWQTDTFSTEFQTFTFFFSSLGGCQNNRYTSCSLQPDKSHAGVQGSVYNGVTVTQMIFLYTTFHESSLLQSIISSDVKMWCRETNAMCVRCLHSIWIRMMRDVWMVVFWFCVVFLLDSDLSGIGSIWMVLGKVD